MSVLCVCVIYSYIFVNKCENHIAYSICGSILSQKHHTTAPSRGNRVVVANSSRLQSKPGSEQLWSESSSSCKQAWPSLQWLSATLQLSSAEEYERHFSLAVAE